MTIAEIVERFGVSRQTLHRLRARGVFPTPVAPSGSTRLRWREDEVVQYFDENPKKPGRRTDLNG